MRERFHERWRDKTRDNIAKALNSLGLRAEMAERGRPEEEICKRTFTRSIGVIDVAEGPFRWVNIVKQDGNQYSPTRWWTVFCLPDEGRDDQPDDLRYVDNRQAVDIKTSREKSFPLFGRVTAVTWTGDDRGTGLFDTLSGDPAVVRLAKKVGCLEISGYNNEFRGWTVQVDTGLRPKRQDWEALLWIAEYLLPPSDEEDA